MMDIFLGCVILALAASFAIGLHFGKQSEAARWRANANLIFRIESAGNLYKVIHARELDEILEHDERRSEING